MDDLVDSDCQSVILSDEDLLGKYHKFVDGRVYPDCINYLRRAKELLGWESMDVWICLRDYGDWLESCYLQKLKGVGKFFSFESYCECVDFKFLSWISLLKEIVSLGFIDKVHVLFYEDFYKNNRLIYDLVEDALGVGWLDLKITGGKMNPSVSNVGYEVLESLDGIEGEDFKKVSKVLLREFPSHQYGKPCLLTHAERSLLKERYYRDVDFIRNDLVVSDKKIVIRGA